jgi:hypothetical protein
MREYSVYFSAMVLRASCSGGNTEKAMLFVDISAFPDSLARIPVPVNALTGNLETLLSQRLWLEFRCSKVRFSSGETLLLTPSYPAIKL